MTIGSSRLPQSSACVMLLEYQMSRQSCKRSRRARLRCRAGALPSGAALATALELFGAARPSVGLTLFARGSLRVSSFFDGALPRAVQLASSLCCEWVAGLKLAHPSSSVLAQCAILFNLSGIALMRLPGTWDRVNDLEWDNCQYASLGVGGNVGMGWPLRAYNSSF